MDVYVVTAVYGPEDDIEPLTVVGYTKEAALEAMEECLKLMFNDVPNNTRDLWIVGDPSLMPVHGEPVKETPPWKTDVFTDADREVIFGMVLEDVRDSVKEHTVDVCDSMCLAECIGYLDEDNDGTIELLKSIRDCTEAHFTADKAVVEFAKKFGLITEEPAVTPRGFEYLNEWG